MQGKLFSEIFWPSLHYGLENFDHKGDPGFTLCPCCAKLKFSQRKNLASMRTGIWLRVSTDMQVEGDSPLHHEKRARGYAEGRDWQVVEVYRLDAVSGKSVMDHPEAKRMLSDIRSGHIKSLIFSKLARLARNTRELLAFSDHFEEAGANLVSLGESIDTSTPAGRLYFTLIAALTQWEREEIAARVSASVPIRAKLGKPLGGAPSFGYKRVDGKLALDENEAPIRRLIYELFIQERKMKAVARMLNERGYRTRNGGDWSDTTLKRLIEDSTAKGLHIANYTKTTNNKKAWALKDKSDWVEQECPAIVSPEIWDEANAIFNPRVYRPKGRPAKQLFAGIAKCFCGGKLYVRSNNPHSYKCVVCNNKIGKSEIETLFRSELQSFFVNDQEVTSHLLSMEEGITSKIELLKVSEIELSKLTSEIDKLYDLYQSGMIDKGGFGQRYQPLLDRKTALDDEIPNLQADIDAARITFLSKEEVISGARDLYGKWPSLDHAGKRDIIETLCEEIVVGIEDITITLLQTSTGKPVHKATQGHGFIAATS